MRLLEVKRDDPKSVSQLIDADSILKSLTDNKPVSLEYCDLLSSVKPGDTLKFFFESGSPEDELKSLDVGLQLAYTVGSDLADEQENLYETMKADISISHHIYNLVNKFTNLPPKDPQLQKVERSLAKVQALVRGFRIQVRQILLHYNSY